MELMDATPSIRKFDLARVGVTWDKCQERDLHEESIAIEGWKVVPCDGDDKLATGRLPSFADHQRMTKGPPVTYRDNTAS